MGQSQEKKCFSHNNKCKQNKIWQKEKTLSVWERSTTVCVITEYVSLQNMCGLRDETLGEGDVTGLAGCVRHTTRKPDFRINVVSGNTQGLRWSVYFMNLLVPGTTTTQSTVALLWREAARTKEATDGHASLGPWQTPMARMGEDVECQSNRTYRLIRGLLTQYLEKREVPTENLEKILCHSIKSPPDFQSGHHRSPNFLKAMEQKNLNQLTSD